MEDQLTHAVRAHLEAVRRLENTREIMIGQVALSGLGSDPVWNREIGRLVDLAGEYDQIARDMEQRQTNIAAAAELAGNLSEFCSRHTPPEQKP